MLVRWKQADAAMARQGEEVVSRLLENGYEAYWVGGCVRDELMGRPVDDMDITTSALPEEVQTVFERTVPTGIQHGTVTVLSGNYAFEVTTYRVEGAYEKHRRPAEVAFVRDLKEDLKRRDFTINAIARDLDGNVVDPFHGKEDLNRRIIRCVGDAKTRFQEDALRMVRCIRFASVFGFGIAYRTWRGLFEERENIRHVAMERFRVELEKMMAGSKPSRGLGLLYRSKLPAYAKAPFPHASEPGWIGLIDEIPPGRVTVRWAFLLLACGLSADEANAHLRDWTFPNAMREQIVGILNVGEAVKAIGDTLEHRLGWIRIVLRFGRESSEAWLQLADTLSSGGAANDYPIGVIQNGRTWTEEMAVYRMSELAVTGKDLLAASGRKGGPWMGEILNDLLLRVASRALPNDKNRLIEEAKQVISTDE
ncbi:CCA tRNA nucleotidyltransferase [Paenibacillus sp. VCA1]|uniref:CCA tRNA nucleotidyltransferase n=1 Tax=Paenibacillus sp. VCA1 TaxID=3039148 RepID=UPI0028717DDF|nr:CCA tRNA nucleotidyltransferase [Paenibacillus sp. VCA1]MDR9853854.1 CCA tRNA nucleotidyltransferase [Paenibacillus sp. VCA1]